MIKVNNLHKSFNGVEILHGVSNEYRPGECSLIIGASGSGKTVLLKSIVGLFQPDEGEVWYDDVLFNKLSEKEKKYIRKDIGMLFQASALFDFATALENVMFPLDFFTDWNYKKKVERARFCLNRVGLDGVDSKLPSELSGGMQKRVGIARAIALNPKYLFCDEPNSGLDPHTSMLIDRLISDLTKEYNITTIINTHDMNSVMEMGDNVAFIHKGNVAWRGSKDEILTSECLELNEFVYSSKIARRLKEFL